MHFFSLPPISRTLPFFLFFFFLNDTATTEISPLPLHDALPIPIVELGGILHEDMQEHARKNRYPTPSRPRAAQRGRITAAVPGLAGTPPLRQARTAQPSPPARSEEHTSELQSQSNLVCRLLLEKKKKRREHN